MEMRNKTNQVSNKRPLVTVVTTVLNGVDHIEQAIQSVLNQTYDNIEYLITDGASTDGTLAIIEKYKEHLSFFSSEPDQGIYDGINKGIKQAKGDYIIVLNADDYYVDDAIEQLVQKALKTGADIVAGHALYLNPDDTVARRVKSRWDPDIYLHATLRHEAMLVAKESYKRIGLYDTYRKVISDRLWMVEAYEQELRVAICNEDIMYFRLTGISTIGEKGEDIRHLEAFNYLLSIDSSLTEKDLFKIAKTAKLTIVDIDRYIDSCSSYKLRTALTSFRHRRIIENNLRVKKKIVRQIVSAWKELVVSKRWKVGYLLTFLFPTSNKEKKIIEKISCLVKDYDKDEKNLDSEEELAYLESWLKQFNLSFELFIRVSLRWKAGDYIVSLTKRFFTPVKSLSPAEKIRIWLVKAKC